MGGDSYPSSKPRPASTSTKLYWFKVSVFFLAVVIGSLALAEGVDATRCIPNCYTKDWQDGSFAGVRARWDIQYLDAMDWNQPYKGLVVQSLWGRTRTDQYDQWVEWVEVGYRHGFDRQDWRGFFWAEARYDPGSGTYPYFEYQIDDPLPGPVGTPYQFMIDWSGSDTPDGRHIYRVYIDGQCPHTVQQVPCETGQANWIQRHQLGGEATDDSSSLGPTHVRDIQNRSVGSQNWYNWSPGTPQVDRSSFVWTWYGDYNTVLYLMQRRYIDHFEGADGSDPDWPKGEGYWSESGGNIFIHEVRDPNDWFKNYSHLHLDYSNPAGYLLMRRDKWDSYTGSPIIVEFGFGEDMANQAGRFFGVWNSNGSAQMGIGVNTTLRDGEGNNYGANNYFYRVNNTFYNTWVQRTPKWHFFRFYIISSGCSYGEVDGFSMEWTNCGITPGDTFKWGVASTWGLTDPIGMDGIWDNAVGFYRP